MEMDKTKRHSASPGEETPKDGQSRDSSEGALKEKKGRGSFFKTVLLFYLMMVLLYLYFMMANLSMAPKFVYTQF